MTMKQWKLNVSNEISRRIYEKGYTQRYVAYKNGIDVMTLNRICVGKWCPSIGTALKLSHFLGCSLDDLIDFGEEIHD